MDLKAGGKKNTSNQFETKIAKEKEDTLVDCPKCKKGHLISRTNKYGKQFFACNHYPQCRYVLNFTPVNESCPDCGWGVLIDKKGQLQCPQPSCGFKK